MTSASTAVCRVCRGETRSVGHADFNKSGNDHFEGRRLFMPSEIEVEYHRCLGCGFMFTAFFDDWSARKFQERIYNHEYLKADPPFADERPRKMARFLAGVLGEDCLDLSILDFGGGIGKMARYLHERGYRHCATFDRYHSNPDHRPAQYRQLVTAFEVVEHVADQRTLFKEMTGLVSVAGTLFLSTLLQPSDIDEQGANWWYACPRNGHMSLHTGSSLKLLLAECGFRLHSLSDELHIAYRLPNAVQAKFLNADISIQVNS